MKRVAGLDGSTLKIIAVASMLVDHTYYAVLGRVGLGGRLLETIMRSIIGRIAFPIFCFLLVQGFIHTSDRTKYKLRLLAFALISEIPFNLAFKDRVQFSTSNVMFTLLLGFVCLEVLETRWHVAARALGVVAIALAANFLRCDYGAAGVVLIAALHFIGKNDKVPTVLAGLLVSAAFPAISPMSTLAYIPIYFYNGERGLRLKYSFYAFYPAHLLVLYAVRVVMLR